MGKIGNFEQIDIHKVKEMIDGGQVTIADVRDEESYREAHIPQAISVSDATLKFFLAQTDKNKPLICYCYHGHSSQSAAHYFLNQGFKTAYSVIGGFEEWRSHYPVKQENE